MEAIVFAIFASIPFYYIWNELAPTYFTALPEVYQHLPFWHCMGLLVIAAILRTVLFPAPIFVSKSSWKWKKS